MLAISFSVKYQNVVGYLFSDEAVYYMMAQSLAFDRDIEYTKGDLVRFYKDWYGGPQGVFLTRVVQDGEEKIYYGKPFIYPLFLAPFVYLFGLRSFLIFNSILLVLMVTMGYHYLKKYNPQPIALLFSLTFFLVTASFVYTFWSTPEVFNMFLITSGLFLLFYNTPSNRDAASRTSIHAIPTEQVPWTVGSEQWAANSFPFRLLSGLTLLLHFFYSESGRKYLSASLLGLAAFSKPSNGLFILPVLVGVALSQTEAPPDREWKFASIIKYILRRYKYILRIGSTFLLVIGIFYGIQFLIIGQWNAYAGDRKMFYWHFPFESANASFSDLGGTATNDVYFEESFYFNPKVFLYNLFYYVLGRFTGMLPYYFPALVALFCFAVRTRLPRPYVFLRFVLLGAIGLNILAFILMAPGNYHGGSGAVGNRFFVNVYPTFLFLVTQIPGLGTILTTWGVGLLFLAQVLINPFYSSFNPAQHAFRFPYRILPVELTVINALPTNVNRHLVQRFSSDTPAYDLYFLDDNYMGRTHHGFWVRGEAKLETVLRTGEQQEDLLVILENGPFENTVEVEVAGTRRSFRLDGDERREVIFPLKTSFPFFKTHLYPIQIISHSGFIPRFAYEEGSGRLPRLFSPDDIKKGTHYLGCLVQISLNPGKIGLVYQKNGDIDRAIPYLERAIEQEPENPNLYIALSEAYQRIDQWDRSRAQLERAKLLIPNYVVNFVGSMGKEKSERITQFIGESENGLVDLKVLRELLTQTFEAEDLQRTLGDILSDAEASGGKAITTLPDQKMPGFLTYGPFQSFPAGSYQIKYRIKINETTNSVETNNSASLLALLDVQSDRYGVLAKYPIWGINFVSPNQYQDFSLDFVNPGSSSLEFRVETYGVNGLSVDKIEVYPLLPFQITYMIGTSYAKEGAWEQALNQFLSLFEVDSDYPNLFYYMTLGWVKLKKWDEASNALQHRTGRSYSFLFEELKNDGIPQDIPFYKYLEQTQESFQPQKSLQINFDNQLIFLGYDLLEKPFKPSEVFPITYYWKAQGKMDRNYAIFVHFSRKNSSTFIRKVKQKIGFSMDDFFQHDHFPLQGLYPTDKWLPREIIKESYQVQVPAHLEPGIYEIWLGIWDPKGTRQRLKAEGQERVKIGEIEIRSG